MVFNPDTRRSVVRFEGRVIGCLLGDVNIMHMTFAEACVGNANITGFALKIFDVSATCITHPGSQSADELKNGLYQRPLVGDPTFNSFRDQFLNLLNISLKVTVFATFFHCA
jgi:hypothetical protein